MKKKRLPLKLNKNVISKFTESTIKGGTRPPSAGGSCFCGGNETATPQCYNGGGG